MELETQGEGQMVDITGDVARMVSSAGLVEGQVLLFCTGSTGGITTIEYEPGKLFCCYYGQDSDGVTWLIIEGITGS